jgi:NitT/TauT family transport system substrate-binding protein
MSLLLRSATAIGAMLAAVGLAGPAAALDEVTFGTNWLAQAEHGGFYQAIADGTYEKHGLKVTIRQGGPQAGNQALLIAGTINFYMQGNMLSPFDAAEQDIPVIQKEPQVLIAHPDAGVDKFEDLAKLPTLFLSKDGYSSYFLWMKSAFKGFSDEQYKPYTFNSAPFIADKQSAQQGYITSEPYAIEKEAGWAPKLFLLADEGFNTYSTLIEGMKDYVDANPDITKRFVEASIIGWYNYLYGDNAAANALIKTDNPEMTDEQIAFSIAKLKEYGIVDSGDTETKGIGCMTDERQKDFYEKMVKAGVVKAGIDYTTTYTTDYVCKGIGLDLKK